MRRYRDESAGKEWYGKNHKWYHGSDVPREWLMMLENYEGEFFGDVFKESWKNFVRRIFNVEEI